MSTVGPKMLFCFGPSVVGSAIQFGCVVNKISLIHKIKKEIGGHILCKPIFQPNGMG